jgi:cobalt/nickel transport system permease protein
VTIEQDRPAERGRGRASWWLVTLVITVGVVIAAAVWASEDPDGLERVAEDLGFADAGAEPGYQLLPDYTLPGLDGVLSTAVAGVIGIVVVVALMYALGRLLAARRS